MALVYEGLKAKVERLNIIVKKCKIENSEKLTRSVKLKFLGKRTFYKGPKWELEDVDRLGRLSCLQAQAEIEEER